MLLLPHLKAGDVVLAGEAAGPLLSQWQNFYVIAGSSAGALTGLQFVVMALIKDTEHMGGMSEVRAFGTPTVVHFCAALLVSAIGSAPWPSLFSAANAFAFCGAAGVVYAASVIKRAASQTGYKPDPADWFWYAALPLGAYTALTAAAISLPRYRAEPLFVIAAATLLLLFAGIHNAWDTVTYVAVSHAERTRKRAAEKAAAKKPPEARPE